MKNSNLLTNELTDQTLNIIREFLKTIEESSKFDKNITRLEPKDFTKAVYDSFIYNYEHFKSQVHESDLPLYEKVINYICVSGYDSTKLNDIKELRLNSFIESMVFSNDYTLGAFNTPVGIQYHLIRSKGSFKGICCSDIDDSYYDSQLCVSSAYKKLFAGPYLLQISKGVIKANSFQEGSFIKMKFWLTTIDFDSFKKAIANIINDNIFKRWCYSQIPTQMEDLEIRLFFTIRDYLKSSKSDHHFDDLNIAKPITFKCIDWTIRKCTSIYNPQTYNKKLRDIIMKVCLQLFIPDEDKEFFYKITKFLTLENGEYAILGYNGLLETNKKEAEKINLNLQKMERRLREIVFGKSANNREIKNTLNVNTFSILALPANINEFQGFLKFILDSDVYKNFNPNFNDNEIDLFLQTTKFPNPFESIGISEETALLVTMVANCLLKIPEQDIREEACKRVLDKAKRIVNKNNYLKFKDIVLKIIKFNNGIFENLPEQNTNLQAVLYSSRNEVFFTSKAEESKENSLESILMKPNVFNSYFIKDDRSFNPFCVNSSNNIELVRKTVESFIEDKLIYKYNGASINARTSATTDFSYYLCITPIIKEFNRYSFELGLIVKIPHWHSRNLNNLFEIITNKNTHHNYNNHNTYSSHSDGNTFFESIDVGTSDNTAANICITSVSSNNAISSNINNTEQTNINLDVFNINPFELTDGPLKIF